MLSNTATINLEVPSARNPEKSVTLNLKVKKDRLAGKKGRADIKKRLTYADDGHATDGLLFNLSQVSQGGQDYKAVMGRLWIFSESLSEDDQLKLVPAYAGDNYILDSLRRHSRYASVQRAAIDLISSQKTLMSLVESTTGETQDLVIGKLGTPMAIAEELRGMYWRKASSITKEKLLRRLGELLADDVSEDAGLAGDADELSQQIAYAIDLSYRAPNRYNVPFEEDIAATRAMLDSTHSWVVRRYLAETTDRVTTTKLATSDPHPEVRAVAIENLGEEQDLLYKTILEEPVARVRAAGAAVLEDLSAVEFLIWKDPAISVRMSALGTMKYGTSFGPGARDEEEGMRALTRVLAEHPDRELRLAAAKYIKEPGPKEAFAYSDPDPKVRLLCLRGVKDQAVLEKVVTTDPSEMVCRALLSRLKGTDIFFTLAASSPHPGVRQLALRYTDDDTRIAAAVASTDKMLRRYALKYVQDPQRLVELRRVSGDEELVRMAGTRLPKDLLEAHVTAA
jgi:hypothetical protein